MGKGIQIVIGSEDGTSLKAAIAAALGNELTIITPEEYLRETINNYKFIPPEPFKKKILILMGGIVNLKRKGFNMQLFIILNNNTPINFGEKVENVGQITIKYNQLVAKTFALPIEEAKKFSKWLLDLCQRSTEKYVLINQTLVLKEDVKLYQGK